MFLILLGLIALFLTIDTGPKQVNRVQAPTVRTQLDPPISTSNLDEQLKQIADSHQGTYEAIVFDPASEKTVEVNSKHRFIAASLAKLPVLLTLYKSAARGQVSLDEKISILPSDVQNYGTGVLNGYPVGSTMTLRKCASYLIKESDNTAWVMLERRLGTADIEAELEDLGADNTDYEALLTTPEDVLLMLRAIADPSYTTQELSAEMLSLMTNTAYEDRLPASLPKDTRVAHKIGSYNSTFSDAGIVFDKRPDGRKDNYFIVVVGRHTTEDEARDAIRQMSISTYESLVDPSTD